MAVAVIAAVMAAAPGEVVEEEPEVVIVPEVDIVTEDGPAVSAVLMAG